MLFQLIIKPIRDPTTNHDFCDNFLRAIIYNIFGYLQMELHQI